MDFLTIQGLTGKLQAHKERVNGIQEDIGAQAFFKEKKTYSRDKQDGYGYTQWSRGHGQGRGRGRFEKGDQGSFNRSIGQPNKAN